METQEPKIKVKELKLGTDVVIHPTAIINCIRFEIGDRSSIGPYALIEGRDVAIGKEAWIGEYAQIGGGSCFAPQSRLKVGDFFHMGRFSIVNTARSVQIGDEVGLGTHSCIFTHGAYLSEFDGFPVKFAPVTLGHRVWMPYAIVNPGVTVGDDVVVAAMSLVNKDLPSGCLAGGIPARVMREKAYPKRLQRHDAESLLREIADYVLSFDEFRASAPPYTIKGYLCRLGDTEFDLENRTIHGPADRLTEAFKNELRRHGTRFRYYAKEGSYVPW